MKLVHLELIVHPNKNQQHTGKAGRKPDEIDEEGTLESQKIPVGDEQVVSDHSFAGLVWISISTPYPSKSYITNVKIIEIN